MSDSNAIAAAQLIATKTYMAHPNYAQKLIHTFPAPLVDAGSRATGPGDLPGMWYEALYISALNEPVKCLKTKLYLTMAYRRMCDDLRKLNRLKVNGPDEWLKTEKHSKYYLAFEHHNTLLIEDNEYYNDI
jgi:hypothetical protein